jgi:membrane dipeptidase
VKEMNIKSKSLNNDLLIFDSHCDTANVLLDHSAYFIEKNQSHLTFEKIRKGGLKAQIFAIWVNPVYSTNRSLNKAMLLYNTLEKNIISQEQCIKVTSTTEMQSAIKKEKFACWLSLEGGHIIENSIENLEKFYSLGFRSMTLVHTKNTDWADSSGDKPQWDGLNKLGKKIIKKMDELKMAIDVSHSSDKTVEDVLEVTSMPVMASHSCSRVLCDISRNIPDNLIREIAERNGYIGVNFFPGFLKKNIYDQVTKNMKKYEKWYQKKIEGKENNPDILNQAELELYNKIVEGNDKVDLNTVIDHIAHIADVGGIDCVGLGSDFDGIPSTPTDLTDVSCYPSLIEGLSDRGFNRDEIQKIMGLNLFNFLKYFDR